MPDSGSPAALSLVFVDCPEFAAAQGLWQAPNYAQALEDQYGMYEQMRNYGDWERINEQMAREKSGGFGQVQVHQEDYDMEL